MEKAMGTKWYVRRCAAGTGICLGMYVLMTALCATLTVRGVVGEGQTQQCLWLSAAIASFAGAALSGNRTVKRGTVMFACGGCFFLAVLLLGFILGDKLTGTAVLRFAVPAVIGTLGAYLLTGGRKRSGKRRGRAHHSRR